MGSRLRPNPKNLFEVFVEVARPTAENGEAFILQKYPEEYNDQEALKSIPKFAFPSEAESTTVDHFTFVLTDIDSRFRFCFCRHATGAQTGLCILSCFPWYEIFYKLLNYLAEITNRNEENSVVPLLKVLYNHHIPQSGELCDIITPQFKDKFSFTAPNPQNLPAIPENRNLTEYYNAVDTNNMMIIFASMLYERRILIVSRKLSRLTACVHASAALLYPMSWQHLYIPILPPQMIDYCSAPMPYLIGIHISLLQKLHESELGDAVILDADRNVVKTEYDDLSTLPADVVSGLRKRLRGQQSDKINSGMVGDWLARSFLKAMVALIGGYRDALRFRPGERISFDPEAFIQSRPQNMQPFLGSMLQLQIFEQFINDRLNMLNLGKGFADEFEMENNMMGDKWGTQSRYKDWATNMKKLKKGGKERWSEFTGKANPAMKHAVRTWESTIDLCWLCAPHGEYKIFGRSRSTPEVKDKSKKTFSNIKNRLDEFRESPDRSPDSSNTGSPSVVRRNRPQTIPVNTPKAVRPPRPVHAAGMRGNSMHPNGQMVLQQSRMYKVLDLDSHVDSQSPRISKRQSADDSEIDITLNRNQTIKGDDNDDGSDQDIKAILKKSFSLEDLAVEEASESTDESSEDIDLDSPIPVVDHHYHVFENQDDLDSNANENTLKKSASGSALQNTHGSNEIFRPTPAPRTSTLRRDNRNSQSTPHFEVPQEKNQSSNDLTSINNNNLDKTIPLPGAAKDSQSIPSLNTTSSSDSLENVKFDSSQGSLQSDTNSNPLPAPRLRRNVSRKPAFYNNQRPASLIRSSPVPQAIDAQTIPKARTEFMQSTTIPKMSASNPSLDDFDPLLSGQLAIDKKSPNDQENKSITDEDENLLIDWTGIDFAKRKPVNPPPPIPPKPNINNIGKGSVGYINLMQQSPASPAYHHHHSPSGLPRMGVAAVPGQPMMRPYMGGGGQPFMSSPGYAGRPMSMYATSTPTARGNSSFLHSLRQSYTGPQANLQLPKPSVNPSTFSSSSASNTPAGSSNNTAVTNTSMQDPFGDLLSSVKSENTPQKQSSGINHLSASMPRLQQTTMTPVNNQSGIVNNLSFQSTSQSLAPRQLQFQTGQSQVPRQITHPVAPNNNTPTPTKAQWEKFE